MAKHTRLTEAETEVDNENVPSQTVEERNKGISNRIASVEGATVADLGKHPKLKLRTTDNVDAIINSVGETMKALEGGKEGEVEKLGSGYTAVKTWVSSAIRPASSPNRPRHRYEGH